MDELQVASAGHLRLHRQFAPDPARDEQILAIWYECAGVPHCRYYGKPITEGDDAFDVEQMRAARACADCYTPF